MIYEYPEKNLFVNEFASKVVFYNESYKVASIIPVRWKSTPANASSFYYLRYDFRIPYGITKIKALLVGAGTVALNRSDAIMGGTSSITVSGKRYRAPSNSSYASYESESYGYKLSNIVEHYSNVFDGYGKGGRVGPNSIGLRYKCGDYFLTPEITVSEGDYCYCEVGYHPNASTYLPYSSDGFIVISYKGNTLFNTTGSTSIMYTEPGRYQFKSPYGYNQLTVSLKGGGGGGGAGYWTIIPGIPYAYGGNGGKGACIAKRNVVVTPNTNYDIIVGDGGEGSASLGLGPFGGIGGGNAPDGQDGSPSSFSTLLTAPGGKGGKGVYAVFDKNNGHPYRGAIGANGADASPQNSEPSLGIYGIGGIGAGRDNTSIEKGGKGSSGAVLIEWG